MEHCRCIVVGVDYSECGLKALKEAARLAKWHGARLICLHVFEEEIVNDFLHHYELDHSEILRQARQQLEIHVTSVLGDASGAEPIVVIGHPFREILREVKEANADLLVLGSRGHRQKDPRRTGVFAAKCIRKAPVEVLLVRQHQEGPFQSIVACVDFSDTSKRAVRRAVEIARQDSAPLELLHVVATPLVSDGSNLGPAMFMSPLDTTTIIKSCQAMLQEWIAEIAAEGHTDVKITATVKEGISASNVLIEHLHESEADLAVLGTRGRTGMKGILLGTTAERLIHEAPCSALAIKPEDFHYELH